MIHELLDQGNENAITGRELATILNISVRDVTEQVSRERRSGHPICAASGEVPGYYLARDDEELSDYCSRLNRRARELQKTRRALANILRNGQGARVR